MLHVCWRREMRTWFWLGNLKERGKLKDVVIDGKIILRHILKK